MFEDLYVGIRFGNNFIFSRQVSLRNDLEPSKGLAPTHPPMIHINSKDLFIMKLIIVETF